MGDVSVYFRAPTPVAQERGGFKVSSAKMQAEPLADEPCLTQPTPKSYRTSKQSDGARNGTHCQSENLLH